MSSFNNESNLSAYEMNATRLRRKSDAASSNGKPRITPDDTSSTSTAYVLSHLPEVVEEPPPAVTDLEKAARNVSQPSGSTSLATLTNLTSSLTSFGSKLEENVIIDEEEAPEGGYGWVVLFVCHMMAFFALGITYCWGIVQARLYADGLASVATLSLVGGLATSTALFALINGKIVRVIGSRQAAFAGTTLIGCGSILSSFAVKTLWALFITEGVIKPAGISLCFMTFSTLPSQWFHKKRGLANGIVYAGAGTGGAILSLLMDAILTTLGAAWMFRIIGLIILGVMLPLETLLKERNPTPPKSFVDWGYFKDFRFILILVSSSLGCFSIYVAPFFLPMYCSLIGMSTTAGALLIAGFNLSSAGGRILFGFISDAFGPLNSLFASLILSALSMLVVWMFATTPGPLAIFVILNGIASGSFWSLIPTVIAEVCGPATIAISFGMISTCWVGGEIMGSPIAGYLMEAAGGQSAGFKAYHPAMIYAAGLSIVAAVLVAVLRFKINSKFLSHV